MKSSVPPQAPPAPAGKAVGKSASGAPPTPSGGSRSSTPTRGGAPATPQSAGGKPTGTPQKPPSPAGATPSGSAQGKAVPPPPTDAVKKSPAPPAPGSKSPMKGPPPPPGPPGGAAKTSPAPPAPGSKSPMKGPPPPPGPPGGAAKKSPAPPAPGSKSPMKGPPPPPAPPGSATPNRSSTPKKLPPAAVGGAKGPAGIAKRSPDRSVGPKNEDGTVSVDPQNVDNLAEPPASVSPKKLAGPKRSSPAGNKSASASAKNGKGSGAGGEGGSSSMPAGFAPSTGVPHRAGDVGAAPASEHDGVPSARLVIAADKDVIDDWRERNIHGDVPFNVPVKDVIERLLLLRLKWDAGLEGLVPVETRGTDYISLIPVPEVVIPVAYSPRELRWEPGLTYFVWLQRSGKLDGGASTKTRNQLYRERLRAYYQYYAPDKEREVDAIVTDFEGSEDLLFARLAALYGPEPTEPQLRRRRFQLQNEGIPSVTLHAAATSSIGATIRDMQVQHLKDSGRYDVDKQEREFNPHRPSEAPRGLSTGNAPLHPRNQKLPPSSQLLPQDAPSYVNDAVETTSSADGGGGGGTFASGLIRHALTSVMTRMNGSLLLALYYKRWLMLRQVRFQQRRICNYLRGSFDVVLRKEYYDKWRSYLGTRRMRRQVQQSTQLAARSEGLVGDLMTENSMLKGELKRLRTQVEMLDNNSAKRLETLYSSSELAIGQIRTLTAENHQKEQLIQQLEQRLMHVGNLMLKANDEKESVLEQTAAEKVFLLSENERLQNKTTLLEDALAGANKQLDAWRPRPATASCEHCPHYFDLEREMEVMHKNADVLRARVKDVEADKLSLRETINTLGAQLRDVRAGKGMGAAVSFAKPTPTNVQQQQQRRSSRTATPSSPHMHSADFFNGRGNSSDDGGSPPPPPPMDSDDEGEGTDDTFSVRSGGSIAPRSGSAAAADRRANAAVNTTDNNSGGVGNASMLSTSAGYMPRRIHHHNSSANGHESPIQLHHHQQGTPSSSRGAGAGQPNSISMNMLPPALASTAPGRGGGAAPDAPSVVGKGSFDETRRPSVRTLADSFQASIDQHNEHRKQREEQARHTEHGESHAHDRWGVRTLDPGAHSAIDNRHVEAFQEQNRRPSTAQHRRAGDDGSTAQLSLENFFHSEEQRFDERLRMSIERQTHNRLRTSGFALEHGTIRRDVEQRFSDVNHQVLHRAGGGGSAYAASSSQLRNGNAAAANRAGVSENLGTYRVASTALQDQNDLRANRESAGESMLLRGVEPHGRPKTVPERDTVETQLRGVHGAPAAPDPLKMRQSIFSYAVPR